MKLSNRYISVMDKARCLVKILALPLVIASLLIIPERASAIAKQSSIDWSISSNLLTANLVLSPYGTFQESTSATILVSTDNFSGYTLSISSNGGNTLVNSLDETIEIESIQSILSENNFRNNTNYNNQFGYKPSKYVTTINNVQTTVTNSNGDYLPIPSSTADAIDITSTANSVDNSYNLSFGIKADYGTPSGTYNYEYILSVVGNPDVYNITYDDNTQDTVTGMPSPNPLVVNMAAGTAAEDSYATLSSNIPVRADYTFGGWCTTAPTLDTNTGNDVCNDTTYRAGDSYPIDQTADGSNITLYAIWLDDPFPIVWSQMGKCIFDGKNNDTDDDPTYIQGKVHGSECQDYKNESYIDTGISLYSQDNYAKDYEVHFTIDKYVYNEQQDSQATMFSEKLSTSTTTSPYNGKAPGLVIRKASSAGFEIKSTYGSGNNPEEHHRDVTKTGDAQTAYENTDVRVFRINGIIYTSLDNGPVIELQDYNSFNQQFGLSAWFGAYPDNVNCSEGCTQAKRFFEGELSNMYIKLGDFDETKLHEVMFYNNDNTSDSTKYLVMDGDTITTFPTVTRNDWTFGGWYDAASDGSEVTAPLEPDDDMDIYARWYKSVSQAQIVNSSINLAVNDTEAINITNGSLLEPYTLISSDSTVASVNQSTGVITAHSAGAVTITITGTITNTTQTISVIVGSVIQVTFDPDYGSEPTTTVNVAEGGTISASSMPQITRTGYALEGWYTDHNGEGTKLLTSTQFNSNTPTTYYANWEEEAPVCKVGTVQHQEPCQRTSGGCAQSGYGYSYGDPIYYGTLITTPNTTTPTAGDAFTCNINGDMTYDEETERFYFIGMNGDNAKLLYYKNISNVGESYADAKVRLPTAETTGWTNDGLIVFSSSDYDGEYEGKVGRYMLRNEAYALCNNTTLNLGLNGKCLYILEKSNFANTDIRDGYWLGSTDNSRVHTASRSITNNSSSNGARLVIEVPMDKISLNVAKRFEITFDSQNGDTPVTETIIEGDTIGTHMPSNPTYTDHIFQRWYDVATNDTVTSSTEPDDDMTVYAEWKGTVDLAQVANNNISIPANGIATVRVTNSSDIEQFMFSSSDTSVATIDQNTGVVTPISEGTTYISITGGTSNITNQIVTVTITQATPTHTITFNPQNGENTSQIFVPVNTAIDAFMQVNPTWANHVFQRWYDSENSSTTVTSETVPTSDMVVYAEWKLDIQQATFTNNDFTLSEGGQITVDISNSSTLEPYTFSSLDPSIASVVAGTGVITGESEGTTIIRITGTQTNLYVDITVDVTAAPVTMRSVTFNTNGGTLDNNAVNPTSVVDGTNIGTLPTASKTNYRFFGWYKDNGTFYEEVYPEEVINSDVTFYARWIEDTTDFPIEFAIINECEFDVSSHISGTYCLEDDVYGNPINKALTYIDSGIALYDTAAKKSVDYEIGFTIKSYDYNPNNTNQTQITFMSIKKENSSEKWPGLAVRRYDQTTRFEFTHSKNVGTKATDSNTETASIHHVKVVRQNDTQNNTIKIKYSINDGALTDLQDVTDMADIFPQTVWFGASAKENGTPQRQLTGKLTDMYVKVGTINEYIINLDGNGGTFTGASSRNITVGQPVGALPTPTHSNPNYTFAGWYNENNELINDGTLYIPTQSETLTAEWTYASSLNPVLFEVTNAATRGYNTYITSLQPQISVFNEDTTTVDPDYDPNDPNKPMRPSINWSTWGNTSKSSFITALKNNYETNNCQNMPGKDTTFNWADGSVNCSKPDVYDTNIDSALNVYLYDTTNQTHGSTPITYAQATDGIIRNMIPGQSYYWEKANDSTVYGVVTATSVNNRRLLDVGDIWNVRDLGGLDADTDGDGQSDGKVKYGKLIRGGRLNTNSANIDILLGLGMDVEYNIANSAELSGDIRFGGPIPNSNPTTNFLGSYINDPVIHYNFDYGTAGYSNTRQTVYDIMYDVVHNNKNIYFHCRVGSDRTGTIAYLLEGLLGVPNEQRYEDYELTHLAGNTDRTRYYDQKNRKDNYYKFLYMMGYVQDTDDIKDWFLSGSSNVSDDEDLIDDFRTAMIEFYP